MKRIVEFKNKIGENISKVMVGKDKEIELIITAFLAKGHVLLKGFNLPQIYCLLTLLV